MANTTSTPNMNLVVPTVGADQGPDWANNLNADLSIIDQHNHSTGQGVPIQPNGININADLPFNGNNATLLRTTRFSPQASPISNSGSDVGALYVSGNELYYNDVTGGHQVQLTASGSVNATSSGISSGTASAAFSAGVLQVKSSSTSFGNVAMQSAMLANSGNLTNQLTLQAPALSGSITQTLPSIPASQSFMAIDASGNMSGYAAVSGGITGSMIASTTVSRTNQVAVGQQISSSSGAFSTNSTSPVDITNLSVTITTTGRPVIIACQSDGNTGTGFAWQPGSGGVPGTFTPPSLVLLRGAGAIAYFFSTFDFYIANSGQLLSWPPSTVYFMDTPSAGTYTYKLQANVSYSGNTFYASAMKLVAYEL